MDLKKLYCSPPIFQCDKSQLHLPDLSAYLSGPVYHIWKLQYAFSTSLHICLILCTVIWDSFQYFKMTEKL